MPETYETTEAPTGTLEPSDATEPLVDQEADPQPPGLLVGDAPPRPRRQDSWEVFFFLGLVD